MTSQNLHNDIARCHDDDCPERALCLRWIQRDSGWLNTPRQSSFRGYGQCTAFRPISLRAAHDIAGDAAKFDFHERKEH